MHLLIAILLNKNMKNVNLHMPKIWHIIIFRNNDAFIRVLLSIFAPFLANLAPFLSNIATNNSCPIQHLNFPISHLFA